ncbi:MAG: efflux RND transporter periplasmic adaptor subunit [Cytophagales bacterium]|nr:efflux RND transporter periplasmic adaptor subunit [Cytophagales bacterium]
MIYLAVQLLSCTNSPQNTDSDDKKQLDEEQLKTMEISLEPIKYQSITPHISTFGKIALLPGSEAVISSNIDGKIESIHVLEGSLVKKGQLLITLKSMKLIEMQEEYLSIINEVNIATIEYERQKTLMEKNITSLAEFQQLQSKYRKALNRKEGMEERLKLIGLNIDMIINNEKPNITNLLQLYAPINGFVNNIFIEIGMSIDTDDKLVQITNSNMQYADIDVFEKDIDQIYIGQKVDIDFVNQSIPNTEGYVKHIVRKINAQSRAVKVHVAFTDHKLDDEIIPEMAVKATFKGKILTKENATVKVGAIVQEEELHYIFVADKVANGYNFTKIKVSLGESDSQYTEIFTSTPLPGKLVVSSNAYLVAMYANKMSNIEVK